jgi:hypothetical protein
MYPPYYLVANCFNAYGHSIPQQLDPQGLSAQAILNYTIYYNILASLIIIICISYLLFIYRAFGDSAVAAMPLWLSLFVLNGFSLAGGLICANIFNKYTQYFTANSISVNTIGMHVRM